MSSCSRLVKSFALRSGRLHPVTHPRLTSRSSGGIRTPVPSQAILAERLPSSSGRFAHLSTMPPRRTRQAAAAEASQDIKTAGAANDNAAASTKEKNAAAQSKKPTKRKGIEEDDTPGAASKGKSKPETDAPPAKKRNTKKDKANDAAPLAERTAISSLKKPMYIGAHVSSAGGVQNTVQNALQIGANSFALFLKSQRKWANPPMADEAREGFLSLAKQHSFEAHKHCLPHGSYLVNLAQPEKDKADQAYEAFVDDLRRCEALGIRLYNFHPGNSGADTKEAAIARIADQLNRAHRATSTVVTVLENMAGQGNVVGSTFEDLRDIIARVDDKGRVGVCIDTCHAFAAGYDLRTPEAFAETMARFEGVVGGGYLRALHLNDSKAPFGSNRDLHANIGTGFLGLRAFHSVMNHAGFAGMPMVLETPIDRKGADGKSAEDKQVWADEIKLLESLIGMDAGSAEFAALEKRLCADGAAERSKIQDQVDRKSAKDAKKGAAPKRGKKKAAAESDED